MDLTIEGRMKQLPDIQRNWLWELVIPGISDVSESISSEGDGVNSLIIRCRTAVIPSRGNEPIESNFMGMKQFFPGKPAFGNTFAVTFEETENQIITKSLYEWQQKIFDIVPGSPTAGASQGPTKRSVTKDVYLLMYRYNGKVLERKIRFYNAFPQNVDDVAMDFGGNESVKFSCTFQFDFWNLEK
jgi:hypothetical protein